MKKVFVAAHPIEAKIVADLLETAGIDTVVRGEHLFGLRGGVPMTEDTLPSVWVLEAADYERARQLIEHAQARARFRMLDGGESTAETGEEEEADEGVG